MVSGLLTLIVGTSRETSDFIADAIEHWWQTNQKRLADIRQLVIDLDNGPENASCRTPVSYTHLTLPTILLV